MSDGIFAALSGAVAQERALETVANNVANVGTTGFRGDRLAFREAMSRASGGPTPTSLRYVEVDRSEVDMTEGPVRQTGNPLDLALSGQGFFVVRTPAGDRLTRDGGFMVSPDGVLTSQAGHAVLDAEPADPRRPEIRIPAGTSSLSVASDGTLSSGEQVFGRIRVMDAPPGSVRHEGHSLLAPVEGTTLAPAAQFSVLQGYLEGANVSAVQGMNELISANRSFDAFQRVIQAFRDIDNRTARELAAQ